MTIADQVRRLIAQHLGISPDRVTDEARFRDDLGAFYERVRRDDPGRKKIALVATAHYLLRTMLAMLQTGEVWRYTEDHA